MVPLRIALLGARISDVLSKVYECKHRGNMRVKGGNDPPVGCRFRSVVPAPDMRREQSEMCNGYNFDLCWMQDGSNSDQGEKPR